MEVIRILEKYPYLSSNLKYTKWFGFIRIKNVDVYLSICCENYPSVEKLNVSLLDEKLQDFVTHLILQAQVESDCLVDFLDNFATLMESFIYKYFAFNNDPMYSDTKNFKHFSRMYSCVLKEMESIGFTDAVELFFDDYSRITLKTKDSRYNVHNLTVSLSLNYPTVPAAITNVDLPRICVDDLMKEKTLSSLYHKFCDIVTGLQDFWCVMSSLYCTWTVIEPKVCKYADTRCTLMLENNVLLSITMNPLIPLSCPEFDLIGAEKFIEPYRKSIEINLKEDNWEPDNGFNYNLMNVLGLTDFVKFDEDVIRRCSICLDLQQGEDDTVPVKLCKNEKCNAFFHKLCLARWLLMNPKNEPSFGVVTGSCPICTQNALYPVILDELKSDFSK